VKHVVGLSGGKDSTALALRLQEIGEHDYDFICTPTGDELPEMIAWWKRLEVLLGKPLIPVTNPKAPNLKSLIQIMHALPNNRQRWCTRMLKIEPTIAYCIRNAPVTMYVGLRADEDEREGIYGEHVHSVFSFREWGWGIDEVWGYLQYRGVADEVPDRTDCARCYDQKLREWKALKVKHPEIYEDACQDEDFAGKTFRSPTRDTWPAGLRELGREFDSGRKIRGGEEPKKSCRVYSL
jgi:Phosphoadenosine phosphosulfate reductase family